MGQLTLILGGARSGKSTYGQKLATAHGGQVLYIATARALDGEMISRITVHQQDRPSTWLTLEAPLDVAGRAQALLPQVDVVILDCLTMLVTNLLLAAAPDENQPDEAAATAAVKAEMDALLNLIHRQSTDWILISNEVGLGLVPPYPLGRVFRDLLGWANQRLAALADQVFWMVAGIPVPIHPYRP